MDSPLLQIQRSSTTKKGNKIREDAKKRVLMVLMPWASLDFPGLGPCLIRSILNRDGIPCDIIYGNMIFLKLIGSDPWVERQLMKLPICEVAFTPYYFDMSAKTAADHLYRYVSALSSTPEAHPFEKFEKIVDCAGETLDRLFSEIPWEAYDVIAFSVMMQQTVASLALAKRIKDAYPHLSIIFGGPNTSFPMGEEMMRSFPEIDFVLEGEADGTITQLIDEIRSEEPNFAIPGLLRRDTAGKVIRYGPAAPFHDLGNQPVPDFQPFFQQLESLELTHVQPTLQIETARGCWWGEKHHCTFCGIDDTVMKFRSKTERQVLEEILSLSELHQTTEFFVVDSIINYRFFNTLLPRLGKMRDELNYDFSFFFESKSNLRRDQVQTFRYAGVNAVQPGIESFNDHILHLMDKGTTAARQIQCLKFLAENRIIANWNMIYQNQFEEAEDYRELVNIIPSLHHLPPLHPDGFVPLQLNRFAPNHESPEKYGISNLRPKPHYEVVFPKEGIDLGRLAFYFDFDAREQSDLELKELYKELEDALDIWGRCFSDGALVQHRGPGFVQIIDRRSFSAAEAESGDERLDITNLDNVEAEIFMYCDEVRSKDEIRRAFGDKMALREIDLFFDEMEQKRLFYSSPAGQVVNLPLLVESRGRRRDVEEKRAVPQHA
jgi:ribosomal peptide maturation radical SAM protein 1